MITWRDEHASQYGVRLPWPLHERPLARPPSAAATLAGATCDAAGPLCIITIELNTSILQGKQRGTSTKSTQGAQGAWVRRRC
jgi:hypothetical protein